MAEDMKNSPKLRRKACVVLYLGSAILDRRYPSQFVMPWVMAEVKRRKSAFKEVKLEVLAHVLRGTSCIDNITLFEHKFTSLSKFAKTHQDPRCFSYLTRSNLYCDYECHVFMAHKESIVPELFHNIQEATRRDIVFENIGDSKKDEPAKAFYEVLYLGRARLSSKKITCNNIDDLCQKLNAKEIERKQRQVERNEMRQRHASGTSVKSLPANLEDMVSVTENDLEKQHGNMFNAGVESPIGSADDLCNFSDHHSSSENILETSGNFAAGSLQGFAANNNDDSPHSSWTGVNSEPINMDNFEQVQKDLHVTFNEQSCRESPNKTMLFRLGTSEISLISLDRKTSIIERRFKDISSVSQGKENANVFGFISREKGTFICHVMQCHSCSVVDEIMAVLRSAFQSAYEQNRQQICQMCPLHQLNKLCQEIHNLSSHDAYELLARRMHNLSERDTQDIKTILKVENPQSHEEVVEVIMIGLRRLCDEKQKSHTHISESNKLTHWNEFNILEEKGKAAIALDNFRNKCKKSLTNSFENLLAKGLKKRDEAREVFRQRSATTESENSFSQSMESSVASTPDASPMPSPALKEVHFNFPSPVKEETLIEEESPPQSPRASRPRSSTVGAIPDPALQSRYSNTDHLDKSAKDSLKPVGARRSSTNSPMKQMLLSVGISRNLGRSDTASESGSFDDGSSGTPKHKGSWRQAIFNRVVTPARTPNTPTVPENQELEVCKENAKLTKQQIRSLWKKAILQTLLLIRVEKKKEDLKARQTKAMMKPTLDYEEITPCLKDVTKEWDTMLRSEHRFTRYEPSRLLSSVKKGLPKNLRGDIWWFLVEQHQITFPATQANTPTKDYNDLLKELTEYQHNILIDLGRTFPGHPYFSVQLGPGQLALYNLLKAYSLLDKEIGYCQGLSFIAGILLMHMEETRAFETLRHMMFNLGLRRQFQPNMMPLQIQLYQLTRLIHDNYRDLHDHFEDLEIAPNLYATPWFLTLFASQFPLGFVARVFDLFFMQSVEVLLKVALVLLSNHKELILQCNSFETVLEFIKTTLPEMGIIQMERVINQVFELDISKQLQAYEVEYHVLREEMIYSPSGGDEDKLRKLEESFQCLKNQNNELLEKLQYCNSHQRSLESTIHNLQTNEGKLKSHIKTLEIERKALLNAVAKLKQFIPDEEFQKLDISLPVFTPSLPTSPNHQPLGPGHSKPGASNSHKMPVVRNKSADSTV